MKQHEQAVAFLQKAAEDEALVRVVVTSAQVTDAILGFHCQQAVEKSLKAVLSELGVVFRWTHNLRQLMDLLAEAGRPVPEDLQELERLTPFSVTVRYVTSIEPPALDRHATYDAVRRLRQWAEDQVHAPREQ